MSHRVSRVSVFCGVLLVGLALTGTAFAQSPTATTGAATAIGTTGATVNGTVNANGASTTVAFEYGLTAAYGLTVMAVQSPVTGSTDTAVSADLGELVPNTVFHYRVVATNANGTTNGADMTFMTLQAAPSVLTSPATAVTASGATLNGVVNGHGDPATVTFEYGTDTSYGTTMTADQSPLPSVAVAVPVSTAITGLAAGTTYHYRVVAVNSGGTSYGADMTFTPGVAGAPPTAATDAATGVGTTNVVLNGTVNANGASTVVSFEYGLDTGYGSVVSAVQSPITGSTNTAVSAAVVELAPNTTYHYRVVATNSFGTTNGADMTLTTLPLPPTAATGPAVMVDATTSTLNGTVSANDASTAVTFEYGLDTNYGTTVMAAQSPVTGSAPTAVSGSASGLTSGVTYHFRVVAQSAGGTAEGADMSFVAGAPAPTATTTAASEIGTSSATLNGSVNANGQEATVTFEYGLDTSYGRIVDAIPNAVSGSTETAVAAPVGDLLPNAIYHFRVVASSGGGITSGADMTFTTLAAPSVTTDAATSVLATGAILNGTVSSNGASATVTFEYGMTTTYGTTITADQSPVTGAGPTAVSAPVSGLTNGITYHYRAVGTNANGTTYGEDQTFFTSAPAAPTATTDAATLVVQDAAVLNGSMTANNADTTVTFQYGPTAAYGTTVTADPSPVTGTDPVAVNAAISGLALGFTYHFRVVGTNANGTTNGADMTFTTTSSPAVETGGVTDLTPTSATLNGMANANIDVGTVTPYFQYGLAPASGSYFGAQPGPLTGRVNTAISAELSGLMPNTTYHYRALVFTTGFVYGTGMTFTTPSFEPAPTAVTGAATGIGATTATFNGTVNASDTTTTVVFEYGFDTGYGSVVTADQSPVTGSADTAVSRVVDTLAPSTTFHFRVVVQNADHTVFGADQTLTTAGAPPTATTGSAASVSGTSATLNGTVNPNNDSTTVTFEYGLDTSYGTSVTADQSPVSGNAAAAVSANITGLSPGTTYHFRVAAQNASGTTYGSDATFGAGASLPAVTTDSASSIGATGATLNGTANAGGTSTAVSFEYGETTAYGRTALAAQSPVSGTGDTAVSAAVTGLLPDTLHHFRMVGQNGAGTVYGADEVFTTGAPAPTVTTGAASQIGTSDATLNGIVNANGNLTTVTFEYGLDTSYGATQAADQSPVSGTTDTAVSVTLSGLQPGETYHFRVVGENGVGTAVGADATFAAERLETIPTLNDLALLVFSVLLMAAGVLAIRRGG